LDSEMNPGETGRRMRVDYSRATREELIAIIEMQEQWHLAARFDPVAGALNREGVLDRLRMEMSRTDREGGPLGVGLVDIDNFRSLIRTRGQSRAAAAPAALLRETSGKTEGADALREERE
jgi:diguanylate cyclase